jgi:V/A-type H+/Na+-transporting ATPase subunit I
MIFTTRMVQLFAVVPGKDCERVTEALLREGVMQFVNVSEFEGEQPGALSALKLEASLAAISDIRKRLEGFLRAGGVIPPAPTEADLKNRVFVDVEREREHIETIAREQESIRERQRAIQQEIMNLEDIKRQMELYGTSLSSITLSAQYSFISMEVGKLPVSNVGLLEGGLKGLPALSIALGQQDDVAYRLLISVKRGREQIDKVLSKAEWVKVELPSELQSVSTDISKELSTKRAALADEQKKLEAQAKTIVKREEKRVRESWARLWVTELVYKIQSHFKSSARTVIFTGWVPSSKRTKLTQEISKACENRCYLEWREASSTDTTIDEIPVQLSNPKILAPFQMLVSNFGIPKYGTIDPTLLVMPIYLSMFGLMFADVGQGLILAIIGIISAFSFRKNPEKTGWYQLSWLIIWCGLSSVLFGALFGSFFGLRLFRPLWFDFHGIVSGHSSHSSIVTDLFDVLAVTIYFGVFVICLGLFFNWINLIRARKWAELLFDRGGVFGAWIYAGGIYIASFMIDHDYKEFPARTTLFLLAGLPALCLFVKEPYHWFKHRKGPSAETFSVFSIFNFFMDGVVELLDIFGGYLSNTLSFMRVAGLGIAHVCLMISVFALAEMTSGVASVLILVAGNALVIGLEGLSAGVQALRLNYYEFFTKFFRGSGNLYNPISLGSSSK